jgi:hypothetical protein
LKIALAATFPGFIRRQVYPIVQRAWEYITQVINHEESSELVRLLLNTEGKFGQFRT